MNQITGRTIGVVIALLLISVGIVYASTSSTIGDFFAEGNITAKQIGGVIYTDQYSTIQDAINLSGDIYLPVGVYALSSQLRIYNNTFFHGAGMGKTIIILPSNVALPDTTTGYGCVVGGQNCNNAALIRNWDYNGYNHLGENNITLQDFTLIWGNRTVPSWGGAIYGTGISMRWVRNLTIKNIEIINSPYSAIDISGSGTVYSNPTTWIPTICEISGNRIINAGSATGGMGILITYYVSGCNVYGNHISNATYGIESEDNSERNNIHDNTVTGSVLAGMYDVTSNGNTWSNNNINNSKTGYDSMNSAESSVSHNTIRYVQYGINVSEQRSDISNNDIYYATLKGIYQLSKNYNTITANKIHNTNGEGINLTNSQRNTVQGNSIMDDRVGSSQSYGINESGTSDFNIFGDNFYQNTLSVLTKVGTTSHAYNNFEIDNSGTLIGGIGDTIYTELFIGNGATKNFSMSYKILPSSSNVYVNGTKQVVGASYDYQEFTQSVNLTSAPVNNARIEVDYAQG